MVFDGKGLVKAEGNVETIGLSQYTSTSTSFPLLHHLNLQPMRWKIGKGLMGRLRVR